ncbi:hypothetical protein RBB50_005569 [Rhinocladiella similis]
MHDDIPAAKRLKPGHYTLIKQEADPSIKIEDPILFKQDSDHASPTSENVGQIPASLGAPGLGSGSTATVHAVDESAVVKRFSSANERIQRELLVYVRLGHHENIARLLFCTTTCLVIERGVCLRDLLELREKEAYHYTRENLDWALQAANGLQHIHSRGVVHADVGPQNLILVDSKHVKWVDFEGSGIDYDIANSCYEPYYSLPSGDMPSIQTDIFAFGCLLYELEQGKSPVSQILDHWSIFPQPKAFETSFSLCCLPDIDWFFLGSLISDCWMPRYQNMDPVVEALQRFSTDSKASDMHPRIVPKPAPS